jgi:acetyl-CoA decarbonylase/synthase complex subunit gamma
MEGTLKMIGEVKKVGCEDIIINPMSASLNTHLAQQTLLRRLALDRLDPNAGYPTAVILRGENLSILAPMAICKYPAVILLDTPADELYLPLLTLRQNIYTDPQKPLQVESRVYPIGEPQENSPLVVTTNFSLTYFMVSSEIDASGVPTHLAIVDAEGMSVLTAWSAGKFSAQIIAKALKEMKVENLVKHRKLIIPGYVASLKGELEEEMPGWEALVGPQEASDIGDFFLEMWKN